MNTDTYQNALESTKDSIEDVNNAIGFSLGSLTLEKLITSAITLVICVLVIWLVMRVARRISAHSRLSESLSRFILKVLKIALEFMAILIVADSLGFNVTALLAVYLLAAAFQWLLSYCTNVVCYRTVRDLRDAAFTKIHQVPLKAIDRTPHGDIVARVTADAEAVGDGLLQGVSQLMTGVATIVGTIAFMLSISVPVALVVILLTPLSVLAAGIINSIGVVLFLSPVHLYDSGISGTSMLLGQLTPEWLPLSFFLIVLNVPLFAYGAKKQGAAFTVYSIFAVVVYSASSYVITYVLPIDVSSSSPIAGNDLLLCAVFGGLISGVGSGLTIRFGGAIDGIEVMAVLFAKRLGLTVGSFVMVYNVILYLVCGIVLQSFILPLYSILTYCAAIKTVDFIVEGFDKAKSAMIITTKEEEISKELSDAFGHGITLIDSEGYYKGRQQTIIYFVVNRFQIAKMKSIIHRIDPNAFVTISDVSDIMGSSINRRQ